MNEKRNIIPPFLKDVLPIAGILVLIIAICIVGVMILNGRSNEQLASNPTEGTTSTPSDSPTDAPTEPPTEPPTETPADPLRHLKDKAAEYMENYTYYSDKYALVSFEKYGLWDFYVADFRYMVCGIPTTDSCSVSIWSDGTLKGVSKSFTGNFAYYEITEEMLQRAENKLYTDYSLSKENTSIQHREISMGISDPYITFHVITEGSTEIIKCNVGMERISNSRDLPDKDTIPIPDGALTEETAVYYLSYYVGDTSSYILKEFASSPDGLYTAIFHQQLGGIYTGEMCTVIMREDKSLYNCVVDGTGMYDDVHFTKEDMDFTTENVYAIYGLNKDEWSCKPTMIEWYFGRLTIGFDVRKNDGTDIRYFNVPINYKKEITDADGAVFWAAEFFGKQEGDYEVQSCVLDASTDFPHYDVSFILGQYDGVGVIVNYLYECEVGVADGQIRNASKRPI